MVRPEQLGKRRREACMERSRSFMCLTERCDEAISGIRLHASADTLCCAALPEASRSAHANTIHAALR
eukprot:6202120-Pleurochrysis_carterae.AAC.3